MRQEVAGEFKIINNWLKQQGKNLFAEPIWKLVFSDNETELRHGTFNDFTPSGLFLRQVTETREVPKYGYLKETWILEKWIHPDKVNNRELPKSFRGSYEPFWVFLSPRTQQPIKPVLKAVQFLVHKNQNIVQQTPLTRAAELREEDAAALRREIQEIEDSLEMSVVSNALHLREGVSMSSGYYPEARESNIIKRSL